MTIADSRVVGWQYGYWQHNAEGGKEWVGVGLLHGIENLGSGYDATPLVPLSLLAEAETERDRLTSCLSQANILIEQFERDWYMACDERDRNAAQRDALQSRLDAVVGLAPKWETLAEKFYALGSAISIAEGATMKNDATELRAALGGESHD